VAILVGGKTAAATGAAGGSMLLAGRLALLVASLSWVVGALLSRHLPLPQSIALATAMEMLAASPLVFLAAGLHGDWGQFHLSAITPAGWGALAYLIVFGSLAGFGSYVYLLVHEGPARGSTNAFVNPLIAVVLGATVAGEAVGGRTIVAALMIVAAVAGVILGTGKRE
jgi:drug/metabolite transporter (DMT)-like permease